MLKKNTKIMSKYFHCFSTSPSSTVFRDLKQTRTATPNVARQEKYFFLILVFYVPCLQSHLSSLSPAGVYFMKHIFTLVTLFVSIFAEIPLTPASLSEQYDGR